eukprot:5956063-Ditylum_brightwellii.AAC.1
MTILHSSNTVLLSSPPPTSAENEVGKLDKTPRLPSLEKPTPEKNHETMIHKFRVKIGFSVPPDADICPRSKFAPLLSLIVQQFPATVLQPWEREANGH